MPTQHIDEITYYIFHFVDAAIITADGTDNGRIKTPNVIQTVNGGDIVNYEFLAASGYPSATGFSVAWFTDNTYATKIERNAPYSPFFNPPIPRITSFNVDENGWPTGEWTAEIYNLYQLTVNAPRARRGNVGENDDYFGLITIHQANYDKDTSRIVNDVDDGQFIINRGAI